MITLAHSLNRRHQRIQVVFSYRHPISISTCIRHSRPYSSSSTAAPATPNKRTHPTHLSTLINAIHSNNANTALRAFNLHSTDKHDIPLPVLVSLLNVLLAPHAHRRKDPSHIVHLIVNHRAPWTHDTLLVFLRTHPDSHVLSTARNKYTPLFACPENGTHAVNLVLASCISAKDTCGAHAILSYLEPLQHTSAEAQAHHVRLLALAKGGVQNPDLDAIILRLVDAMIGRNTRLPADIYELMLLDLAAAKCWSACVLVWEHWKYIYTHQKQPNATPSCSQSDPMSEMQLGAYIPRLIQRWLELNPPLQHTESIFQQMLKIYNAGYNQRPVTRARNYSSWTRTLCKNGSPLLDTLLNHLVHQEPKSVQHSTWVLIKTWLIQLDTLSQPYRDVTESLTYAIMAVGPANVFKHVPNHHLAVLMRTMSPAKHMAHVAKALVRHGHADIFRAPVVGEIITILYLAGQTDTIMDEIWPQIHAKSVRGANVDTYTMNALLMTVLDQVRNPHAVEMLYQIDHAWIDRHLVKPNAMTWSTLLRCYLATGGAWDKVLHIVHCAIRSNMPSSYLLRLVLDQTRSRNELAQVVLLIARIRNPLDRRVISALRIGIRKFQLDMSTVKVDVDG